jgi:hypothetical protein
MIATKDPVEIQTLGQGRSTVLWADDAEVASYTHDVDTYRAAVEPSVWVVLPFGRDVLVAACMASPTSSPEELVTMSAGQVRSWALGNLLFEGVSTAKHEVEFARFTDYRDAYSDDPDAAKFFVLVCARVDEAFGFNGQRPPVAHRPATDGRIDETPSRRATVSGRLVMAGVSS